MLVLGAPLVPLGCGSTASNGTAQSGGGGGAASSSAGGGGAAASAFVLPERCAELGLDIQQGCEQCPDVPPVCECGAFFVDRACTFGKCLAAVDCARVCRADVGTTEFAENSEAVRDCLGLLYECNDDTDCGIGNVCISAPGVYAPGTHGNHARCRERGLFCNQDADCQQGSRCVVGQMLVSPETGEAIPFGECSTGEDDQPCVVDSDCVTPYKCVLPVGLASSQCSTGEVYEPCVDDDDCIAPNVCITAGGVTQCSAGAQDQPCGEASDCQSGFCVLGTCTSGLLNASCQGPEDCESGYCSREVGADAGACVTGDEGSPCFNDTACASGLCTINPDINPGICGDGSTGSPCHDDSDCPGSTCVAPSSADSVMCTGPGSPCEDDGVCNPVGQCFKGTCG